MAEKTTLEKTMERLKEKAPSFLWHGTAMGEKPDDLGHVLSFYDVFVAMLSIFQGFTLATITIVSFLQTDLLLRRLTLWFLLASFALTNITLVRTYSEMLKKAKFPVPRWNDEFLTAALTVTSASIGFMLLIGGLTIYESAIWWVFKIFFAYYALGEVRKAKKLAGMV